jgi:DNA repair protein RadD
MMDDLGRPYQNLAIQSIFNYFDHNSGNPLVAMPTGTGKSWVIALFLKIALRYAPGTRVIMLTHVKELIRQNFEKLLEAWPSAPVGIYSAGLKRRESHVPIVFGGIQSTGRNPQDFGHFDLAIIDEAHLVGDDTDTLYLTFLEYLRRVNPKLKVIGLSASPFRLGLGHLTEGKIFTHVCCDMTTPQWFKYFIDNGYMAPLIAKPSATVTIDVTGVKRVGDDYNQKQLQVATDKQEITCAAVAEVVEYGAERNRWLVFGTGIEHCEHVAEEFKSHDVPTVAIHSRMGDHARDQAIKDYKRGDLRCAVNDGVLTTGFDCPEIDLIGVLRKTLSTARWVQSLGRGTRPAPWVNKVNCLVLDFAENARRLGPIDDPVLPRKKGERVDFEQGAPIRICPSCGFYASPRATVCMQCGVDFAVAFNVNMTAGSDAVMTQFVEPTYDDWKVLSVEYTRHTKLGRPDSLRVNYFCGVQGSVNEFICFNHSKGLNALSKKWWSKRSFEKDPPDTTEAALQRLTELVAPVKIKVRTDKKYPEVVDYEF